MGVQRVRECAILSRRGSIRPSGALKKHRWIIFALYMLLFMVAFGKDDDAGEKTDAATFKGKEADIETYLNDHFKEDLWGADKKLDKGEKIDLVWDEAEGFNIKIPGELDPTTFKADNKDIFDDSKLTMSEWDKMAPFHMKDEFMYLMIGLGVVVVIIIIVVVWKKCKKDTPPPAPAATGQVRRRLQQSSPFATLAEAERALDHSSYLPHPGRKLAESLPKHSVSQDLLGLPGLNDHNIWWIIPVSCLTQLMWIYVAYKIYKRCAQSKRRSENAPLHELREITVRC